MCIVYIRNDNILDMGFHSFCWIVDFVTVNDVLGLTRI